MMPYPLRYFEELEINFSDKIVLLDVDGTLTPDSQNNFTPEILLQIEKMKLTNCLYLCTNCRDLDRNKKIEEILGLRIINLNGNRKPSKKILHQFDNREGNFLIIGDKFVIDFLFARNIGADFILVKRKINGQERLLIKLVYLLDNFVYFLTKNYVRK